MRQSTQSVWSPRWLMLALVLVSGCTFAALERSEPHPLPFAPPRGDFVQVAEPICLDTYPNITDVPDGLRTGYTGNPATDTALDFRGVTVEFNPPLNGWNPSGSKNVCVVGGEWIGQAPRTLTWRQSKDEWDGSAIRVAHLVTTFTWENVFIDNSHDGIMLPRTPDVPDTAEGIVRGSIVRYNRDDCIESDGGAAVTVDDSFFECNMFFSMRNSNTGGKDGSQSHVIVRNSLIHMMCMPDDRADGGHCPNVTPTSAVAQIWKLGKNSTALPIEMHDSIILVDAASKNGAGRMWLNQYGNNTYDNVTIVWMGGGPWPGPDKPPGVAVTDDIRVWNKARDEWFVAHNCDTGGYNCFSGNWDN